MLALRPSILGREVRRSERARWLRASGSQTMCRGGEKTMRKYIRRNIRDAVKNKYGGRCAYCGEIPEKMTIDHIHPVARAHMDRSLDVNSVENLMPACFSCNNYKMSFSLEQLRSFLQDQVRMARKYSVNFRLAERYGLISITEKPIVFYFEKAHLCGAV